MKQPKVFRMVSQVKASPLNQYRWMVVLICGHEVWVTRKRCPRMYRMRCAECEYVAILDGFPIPADRKEGRVR